MLFKSKRLIFKEFEENDFELFSSVYTNELVMKYAWYDTMVDHETLLKALNNTLENNKVLVKRSEYEFAVFSELGNTFLGTGLILIDYRYDMPICAEIGYFLLPKFWSNGYATEIAKKLIDFCFNSLNIHRVIATCNANNYGSEKVMIKAGMKKEGEFKKARYKNGKWDDEIQYGILEEDWVKNE